MPLAPNAGVILTGHVGSKNPNSPPADTSPVSRDEELAAGALLSVWAFGAWREGAVAIGKAAGRTSVLVDYVRSQTAETVVTRKLSVDCLRHRNA